MCGQFFFVFPESNEYYHPDGILKKISKNDPNDKWYFSLYKASKI